MVHDPTRLMSGEVHLWHCSLDAAPDARDSYQHTLSVDENARAQRFHSEVDRVRYIVGRGVLRQLLAAYLGTRPELPDLITGENGKPELADESQQWLQLNLAHSDDVAVYAFARDCAVGVDVERIRADLDVDGIARRYMSPAEQEALSSLPHEERLHACVELWTRKEAVLKAMGVGLSLEPSQIQVLPGEPVSISSADVEAHDQRWQVQGFSAGDGYLAAVAVAGHDYEIPAAASPVHSG